MKQEDVQNTVLKLVAEAAGLDACSPEMDLMDEAGLSSIAVMELLSVLEDQYKIKLPARDLRFVATVGDLAELVWNRASHL